MTAIDKIQWDPSDMKMELMTAARDCTSRGLSHGAKWAAELNFALKDAKTRELDLALVHQTLDVSAEEYDAYLMAKTFFDLKEYDRAAHFTENLSGQVCRFLHFYSKYLSGEKKRLDSETEIIKTGATGVNDDKSSLTCLKNLKTELRKLESGGKLDGFGFYLYGVVLKKLDLVEDALTALLKAVEDTPLHWGAWLELSSLINDKETLKGLRLTDHWMKFFFLANTYLELQLSEQALEIYQKLSEVGFSKSTHVMAQMAIAFHNMRDVDVAVGAFEDLLKLDPFRLENMDSYSNLLYVKEVRPQLAFLAHRMVDIDKYRVETCCVVGNYYSLRGEHQKAVFYFQRALKLNPQYTSAWTLMGHEFMEMKNTAAAIQAYRHAIEVNRKDYRAWYGLGQTYEMLKMSHYCLYYYRQAQYLRPNDSRMCVALGEAYEKLDRLQEAKKCYWHAHCVGDVEGEAIVNLAKLYEKSNEEEQAASAFERYVQDSESQGILKFEDLSHAYSYLANYFLKRRKLEQAYYHAQKCTEFNETREMGKSLLRQIAHLRSLDTTSPTANASGLFNSSVSLGDDAVDKDKSGNTTDNSFWMGDTTNSDPTEGPATPSTPLTIGQIMTSYADESSPSETSQVRNDPSTLNDSEVRANNPLQ